jgi:hypothetical protein
MAPFDFRIVETVRSLINQEKESIIQFKTKITQRFPKLALHLKFKLVPSRRVAELWKLARTAMIRPKIQDLPNEEKPVED